MKAHSTPSQKQSTALPTDQHEAASMAGASFESPLYGALATEISQAGTLQGFGLDAAPLHPPALAQDVIQLKVEPGETYFSSSLEYKGASGKWDALIAAAAAAANDIDSKVGMGHLMALQWQQFAGSDNKRLNLWHKTVSAYIQDPESIKEKVLIMRFGYAVEELVSDAIRDKVIQGLQVHLQVGSGSTRPDIVLRKDAEDVAWLDITAEKSLDHIQGKKSTLWTKKPYVAELLYPSLDIDRDIVQGSLDPLVIGYADLQKSDVAFRKAGVQTEYDTLKQQMIAFRDSKKYQSLNAKAAKKKAATEKISSILGQFGNPRTIGLQSKGLIRHLGLKPIDFGLADGKEQNAAGMAYLRASAHAGVTRNIYAKNKVVLASLRAKLLDSSSIARSLKTKIDAANAEADAAMAMAKPPSEDALAFQTRQQKALDDAISSQRAETQKVMAYLESLPLENRIKELAQVVKMDGEVPKLAWDADAKSLDQSKAALQKRAEERRTWLFLQLRVVLDAPSVNWNLAQWKGHYFKMKAIVDSKHDVARIKTAIQADFGVDQAVFDMSDLGLDAAELGQEAASDLQSAAPFDFHSMDEKAELSLADQEDGDLEEAIGASMSVNLGDETASAMIGNSSTSAPVGALSAAPSTAALGSVSVLDQGVANASATTSGGKKDEAGATGQMDFEDD